MELFFWYGVGPLFPLKSSVTGVAHAIILYKYVHPAVENFSGKENHGNPIFQQDNAKPHFAKPAKEAIKELKYM